MYLQLSSKGFNFNLTIEHRISVILGDSASGKTTLANNINRRNVKLETDFSTITSDYLPELENSYLPNTLFIFDEDSETLWKCVKYISKCNRDDLYFLILGRNHIKELPVPIDAVYKFIEVKGITKNVAYFSEEELSKDLDRLKALFNIDTEEDLLNKIKELL